MKSVYMSLTCWILTLSAVFGIGDFDNVTGVTDRTDPGPPVTFQVTTEPNHTYWSYLDGEPIPEDTWITVIPYGYHEIYIERTNTVAGGPVQTQLERFTINDPVRPAADWGLWAWNPWPGVDSSSNECASADLYVVAPQNHPAGLQIPVIALMADASGQGKRINGVVSLDIFPANDIELKRGVGHTLLPAPAAGSVFSIDAAVKGVTTNKTINIDLATSWTVVATNITADTTLPEDSRIEITSDITIASGTTLTIGKGTVVKLSAGVDIVVDGGLVINGTVQRPVVFLPSNTATPWGGFMFYLAASTARVNGAIFVGSGADPNWMGGAYSSHKSEQALFLMDNGANVELTDVFILQSAGQAVHGERGSTLIMNRCLVQECVSVGQFNASSWYADNCAFVDIPNADGVFTDDDNDAIYLGDGSLTMLNSLVFGAKDDGIDAGSGGYGVVTVSNCWIEGSFHEGIALSGESGRLVHIHDTVVENCGQGIEAGFGAPEVHVEDSLIADNEIGLRFGDNYDWSYSGSLDVSGSISINNYRDVWNLCHDIWAARYGSTTIADNWLSTSYSAYPANILWDPATDNAGLAPFISNASTHGTVGVGCVDGATSGNETAGTVGVRVALSMFCTNTVTADYTVGGTATGGDDYLAANGTLTFLAGERRKTIEITVVDDDEEETSETIEIALGNPSGCEISSRQQVHTHTINANDYAASEVHYVVQGNPEADAPYITWATAAANIQDAVNVCAEDKLVLVSNGTYILASEISIPVAITVRSVNGANSTVVSGNNSVRCFYVNGVAAVIDGFTVTNGLSGGGAAGTLGGGVVLDGAGTLQNCLVINNSTPAGSNGDGGGVACRDGGLVRNCLVTGNHAGDDAGGIYLLNAGEARNCSIWDNTAVDKGGGVYSKNGGTVANCTIVDNTGGNGDGTYSDGGTFRNSIIYFNGSANYNQEGGYVYDHCCSTPAPPGDASSVVANPRFSSRDADDYHLTGASPCIDAGTAGTTNDLDGVSRPLDGDNDGGATVDIGACEYVHPDADTDGDKMDDVYEVAYGLDPADPGDAADNPDGDPHSNMEESIADTDPFDPNSCLRITEIMRNAGGIDVQWQGGVRARQYLETRPLFSETWVAILTNQPPTAVTTNFTDTSGADAGYYRVRATR